MADTIRLNKVLRELNISIDRAVDFLESKGVTVEKSPNTKISDDVHAILSNEFQTDASKKQASQEVGEAKLKEKEELREQREREIEEKLRKEEASKQVIRARGAVSGPKQVGKIDLDPKKPETPKVEKPVEEPKQPAPAEVAAPEVKE
ncbi:MAG: translation initiation factor IF-2, partial [Gelidibacter sp.]